MNLTQEEKAIVEKPRATQPADVTLFDLFVENAELQERLETARADERQRCINIVLSHRGSHPSESVAAVAIAAAIREASDD